jgi:IclR family pca regulon transcriptional regulator
MVVKMSFAMQKRRAGERPARRRGSTPDYAPCMTEANGDSTRQQAGRYRVGALSKGLRVLSCFTAERPVLRMNEVAALTAIPMPTAFRLVATLEEEGYLERLPDGSYRPGAAVLGLGFSALHGGDLVQTAQPLVRALARSTGQTVNFGVLQRDRVLYLLRIRSAELVTAHIQIGSSLPAVHAAMGKVLLAFAGDEYVERWVTPASFRERPGPKAVTGIDALRKQLRVVRRNGWAVQDEELAPGLRSIGAPVFDAHGLVVGAMSLSVSAPQWTAARMRSQFKDHLLATCADITHRITLSSGLVSG